jgi:hypothetical protein
LKTFCYKFKIILEVKNKKPFKMSNQPIENKEALRAQINTNEFTHYENSGVTLADALDEAEAAERKIRRWVAELPEQKQPYPIYNPAEHRVPVLKRWVTGCYDSLEEYVIQNRANFDNYDEVGDNYIPTIDEYRGGMRMTSSRLATIPRCGYNAPDDDV